MSQANCEYCDRYNTAMRRVHNNSGSMNLKTKILFAIALLSIAYNFGMYHMFQDKLTKATNMEQNREEYAHVIRTTPFPKNKGMLPTTPFKREVTGRY